MSKLFFRPSSVTFFTFLLVLLFSCKTQNKNSTHSGELKLYLPDNLEATLWAESPMLYNPTNIDVDSRGRIWVAEAVNYRNYNNDSAKFYHHSKGDRIMILEDTDGDGKADSSKVFVQDKDLLSPVGLAVMGNKVIVSCSPNLIVYTDENGDDVPDKKEIMLTGFGGRDHDHSLHAIVAGPDGNWYFNTGNAGPHIVKDKAGWTLRSGSMYTGGSPYNDKNEGNLKSDDGKVWVGGLALRMKPDATGLKVMGHNFRNAYEVTIDSYGNLWQNDNDDQVVTCRTTWLMEGGNAGYFSADGTRSWEADQRPGQDIFAAHWHQEDPGVMPAGDRTGAGSPTGIAINESDVLGKEYLGMLLSADAGRNVIFGYRPSLKKSGYDLGERKNFITSLSEDNTGYEWNDSAQNAQQEKWFRPSDVAIGTDGAIYIADWYDPVVGGHQMKDKKAYGRIYRIAPKNKKLIQPKIDLNTTSGRIGALKNPAVNVRNLGFEKLKQQGEAAIEPVKALLKDENPYIKARAVWLLSQLGERGKAETEKLLSDNDEQLRTVAFRALRQLSADIIPYAGQMAADPSAFVRREAAVALRDVPFEKAKPVLLRLMQQYDGEDRWYLEACGAAAENDAGKWYPEIIKIFGNDAPGSAGYKKMINLLWRLHPAESVNLFASRAKDTSISGAERRDAITALGFIRDRSAALAMIELSKSKLKDVSELSAYWVSFRQSNDWYALLDWKKTGVNTAYEKKLAMMKVKRGIILDESISVHEREFRLREMAMDSLGGQMLIGLAAENNLPQHINQSAGKWIFSNPDLTVRVQAGRYFKRPGAEKVFSIEEISKMPHDAVAGKTVFAKQCATCHRAGKEGNNIGPELTLIKKKFDHMGLLDAIINPGAAIVFGYEPWLINTKEGGSFFGFLVAENKQTITIKDATGRKHIIPVNKISSRKKQTNSLMPDPATMGLTEKNLADVTGYLLTLKE